MYFASKSRHLIRIFFASTALAVLSFCTVAQAQNVNLVIGFGGNIELDQGTLREIPIFLVNANPSAPFLPNVNELDLFVEADLLTSSQVGIDITNSTFGSFGTTILTAAPEDLAVEFRAQISLDNTVNVGTLLLDTSGLTAGDEVTLSFAGSTAGNRAFGNPLPIPNVLNPVGDVSVTVVPEPSGCCLLTVLSAIGFSRRRR